MREQRIVVLVSGSGSNLQAIINSLQKGEICNAKIAAVISSKPDVYALERAKYAGIPSEVIDRKAFSDKESFDKNLNLKIQSYLPDLIVLAGFLCILPEKFCRKYKNKIINVHPSLIPSFCGDGYYGIRVHEEAIKKGVKISGATVHFVDEITDGGPIILQKAVNVFQDDTAYDLQKRVLEEAEWDILPRAINLFCTGKLLVKGNHVRILSE